MQCGYFTKLSELEFNKAMKATLENIDQTLTDVSMQDITSEAYRHIRLPFHKAPLSSWFDFSSPIKFELRPQEELAIPTGVGLYINPGWCLNFVSHHMSDPNGGWLQIRPPEDDVYHFHNHKQYQHIILRAKNMCKDITLLIPCGQPFARGIFLAYGAGKLT